MNDLAQVLGNSDSMLATSTRMGPMLVAKGKINPKDLSMILAAQKKHGLRFGEAALKLGLVKDEDINAILAEQFAYTQTPAASSKLDRRLSALFQPDSAQAEALRSLRSELQLRYFNPQPHRALTLVSAEDAAGSALTAANLAISFAQLGLRTLLIDSNLRRPQLNKLFDLPEHSPGLSDWLAERTSVAPTAIDSVRGLSVLPAGTRAPNPQELLASKHFQERIGTLALRFDVTLISTTPMDSNRDAQLVAAQTGAALLLARTHITSTKALTAITSRLRELGVRLVGASLQG
ncbi:MAG TPA: polysaccharide biosynthesis tyrosine autokinase [Cellvibrio sp.]|nr:polysaccharide biosynthesis tyrosine autokinase [Cellvibrio sp.]